MGEIDIIAHEKGELVFIEVKTRNSIELGYPEQAVGIRKQKKMSQLASWYLQKKYNRYRRTIWCSGYNNVAFRKRN